MTSELFQEWLHELDSTMRKKKRHIVLLLDNCSAHTAAVDKARLSNVQIEWLVANSSSVTQPIDQGVIRSLKSRYRRLLMQRVMTLVDSGCGMLKVTIKDAIMMLHTSWQELPATLIQNCFRCAGSTCDGSPTCADTQMIKLEQDQQLDEVGTVCAVQVQYLLYINARHSSQCKCKCMLHR